MCTERHYFIFVGLLDTRYSCASRKRLLHDHANPVDAFVDKQDMEAVYIRHDVMMRVDYHQNTAAMLPMQRFILQRIISDSLILLF